MNEPSPNHFQTTHWSQIVAAKGSSPLARQALRELCETYYAPVERFIERFRSSDADARDLTHEFFATLLEKEGQGIANADRNLGRFRTYLLGAVKHFLADQRDKELAGKRGGGRSLPSIDESTTALVVDPSAFAPDAYFDREWALTMVEQAVDSLRDEAEGAGEADRFRVLQSWLVSGHDPADAEAAAESLGLSDGAFKVAVHRLRKRFRNVILQRISQTVQDPADVNGELDYLITAMMWSAGTSLPDH